MHHLSTLLTYVSSFRTTLICLSIYLLSLSKYTSYHLFSRCRYYICTEKISLTPFLFFGFKNSWWTCRIFWLVYHASPSTQDWLRVKLSHSIAFFCRCYVEPKNYTKWVLQRERAHTIIHESMRLYI